MKMRDKAAATAAIVTLVGAGLYTLGSSRAASASIILDAAEGTLSAGASIVSDAAAVTGRAVKFMTGGGSGSTALPGFPQKASNIPTFLAPGVKPPTNQWFSNLAFTEPSNPVFAYPLAMQTMPDGFGMMYPKVVSTTNTVFGSYSHDLRANFGTVNTRIYSYDDISVTMEARNSAGSQVATYRLTQGSPIIYVTLKSGNRLSLGGGTEAASVTNKGNYYQLTVAGKTYVATYASPATVSASGNNVTFSAGGDSQIALGILPTDSSDTTGFIAEMQDPITGTSVSYGAGSSSVSTTFSLATKSGNGSLLGLLPAQQTGTAPSSVLGTYNTVMGVQKLYKFSNYTFNTNSSAPPTALNISSMTASEKSEVIAALTTDINNLPTKGFTADDTYFGGKQLARAANMMSLAQQLGQTALAQKAYDALDNEMKQWLNPTQGSRSTKYFYYDTNLKGIVGVRASFGSDTEFNDHHFHYGYFLYAAGLMAQYKPAFATQSQNAEVLQTIIRDIANTNRSDPYFPYLRPFDQYAGHSWASGTSPFVDGNNNESSSEAVNAWYGLYLWAKFSGNSTLETQARWMYGRESDSALTYWTNFDRSQPQFVNYKPSVVSMVWGGKMDYGTWFSPSSYAKLGIQILPVTPASGYLGKDPARVATNLTNLNDGSGAMFTDVMAMYKSFSNPSGAAADAKALPDSAIDDGNSRSWMLAWVYSH